MNPHRSAWHWAAAFFAVGAFLLLVVAAIDESGDGTTPTGDPATVTLEAFPGSGPEPTVTVDPATDLVDHQVVTVHGESFDPDGSVVLVQGDPAVSDFAEINDDGSFTRTVGMAAIVTRDNDEVDCRVEASDCSLRIETFPPDGGTTTERGVVPVTFDPDGVLVPAPTIHASPVTGLQDGDTITLSGENLRPGDGLTATICDTPEFLTEDCVPTTGIGNIVGDDGTFELPYRAAVHVPGPPTELDCLQDDCFLHVGDSADTTATFPLEFAQGGPPAPKPEAFALVVEGEDLRVQGEGFLPGEEVYTGVCIRRDGERQCQAPTPHHTTADAAGAFDTTFTPEPFQGFAGVEDCRQNRCWVFASGTSLPARPDPIRAPFALDP